MTNKTSASERRRKDRQRKRVLNLAIIGGISLIAIGFISYLSSRPIQLIEITSRNFPVPVNGLIIGNPDAPVLVEAFEDFQCPSCLRFTEDFEPLIIQNFVYNGIARFQYRNYPFIGPESLNASNAAMCANAQNRFWDFHDMLYANQLNENAGAFSDRRMEAMADQLGLEMDSWSACYDSQQFKTAIQDDLDAGRARGVSGTPTVFVNGVQVGSVDYQSVAQAISAAAAGQ